MNLNLQVELRRYISSNVVSQLNKFYFENDALLIKAIDTALGTMLLGILNCCEKSFDYDKALHYVTQTDFYKEVEFDNSRLLSVTDDYSFSGDAILADLFKVKKSRISEMISNEIAIKSETAREVFCFAALLTIGYLNHKDLSLEQVQLIVEEQKRGILNSIPNGIKIMLGYSAFEMVDEKNNKRFSTSIFGNLFSQKV